MWPRSIMVQNPFAICLFSKINTYAVFDERSGMRSALVKPFVFRNTPLSRSIFIQLFMIETVS